MRALVFMLVVAFAAGPPPCRAADCSPDNLSANLEISLDHPPVPIDARCRPEADDVGGSIVLDEHLLTDPQHDRDYNGGGEITFSGDSALKYGHWLDQLSQYVDGQIGLDRPGSKRQVAHALSLIHI